MISKKEALKDIDMLLHESSLSILRIINTIDRIEHDCKFTLLEVDERDHITRSCDNLRVLMNKLNTRIKGGRFD